MWFFIFRASFRRGYSGDNVSEFIAVNSCRFNAFPAGVYKGIAVQRQAHYVLPVDDVLNQRQRGERAEYGRVGLWGAHNHGLGVASLGVGVAAPGALVDVAAVLLDDDLGGDDLDALGGLVAHVDQPAAALAAGARSRGPRGR